MACPDLLPSAPPSFSEQLRRQTDTLLSRLVRTNHGTIFARSAVELADFRDAAVGCIDGTDDDALCETFRSTVHFTSYDSYAPLMSRFFENSCKASAVVDLFAPGLPDYLVKSSSTSGGVPKFFAKYNNSSQMTTGTIPDSLEKRTRIYTGHFWCDSIHLEDENDRPGPTVYLTIMSTLMSRVVLHLHPEKDGEKMATFLFDHAAPYATGFIKNWRSFLFIHALFAMVNKSIKFMDTMFMSAFVDMMRLIDSELDTLLDCIANGIIPDLDGISEVRPYLEVNLLPDRERAEELRTLGSPSARPGWCSYVWPNLNSITAAVGGSFATYIPVARSFLGPNTDICARAYGSSESMIAFPYKPLDLNEFKPFNDDVMEFLDISKSESISSLAQSWEVELGRRYEIVLTTRDGLWRYRLGDVVEITGFDPTDGVPIFQFIERRGLALRLPAFMVSEEELRGAISAMATHIPVQIVDWTATVDDRQPPATVGFFIELAGGQVSVARARDYVLDELSRANQGVAQAVQGGSCGKPTIRLVRPGTFSNFRQMKLDEGGSNNLGQIKVPVVLPKTEYVTWFSNRVAQEL